VRHRPVHLARRRERLPARSSHPSLYSFIARLVTRHARGRRKQ
jgi:hypothetical protein